MNVHVISKLSIWDLNYSADEILRRAFLIESNKFLVN